jgi:hypothetical protein
MVAIYDWISNTKNSRLMPTLWTFGDSLTQGFTFTSQNLWAKSYVNWKNYIPLCYGDLIAKKLNLELKNFGLGGLDNYTIYERFTEQYDKFKDGDIIIIGWTDTGRFRLSNDSDRWYHFIPNFGFDNDSFKFINNETINQILVNRTSKLYVDELNGWINFINKITNNFKIIHWTNYNNGMVNATYVDNINKIVNETNGEIKDYHFSEKGQIEISEILVDVINNGFHKKKII